MPQDDKIDTKEEIELERAKIELEKDKADLLKHKFDSYVGIARDIVLIIAILGGSAFNFMNGHPKDAPSPAPVPHVMSGVGEGGGGSGETASVSAAPHYYHQHGIFTVRNGLWMLVGLAGIFLVLPRLKRKNKPEEKK